MALENHKYIAHQLALLYQSLSQIGPASQNFKKRIEKKFETIKSITHGKQTSKLPQEEQKW